MLCKPLLYDFPTASHAIMKNTNNKNLLREFSHGITYSSSVKMMDISRLLGPPTHELRHLNEKRYVTHSVPAGGVSYGITAA